MSRECMRVSSGRWLGLLVSLSGCFACTTQPAARGPDPAAVAELRSSPRLPELQRARLTYLFEAMARVAQDWPWPSADALCVLLIGPETQWVVNCPEPASASFARSDESFRDLPVFMHSGGRFRHAGRELSTAELLRVMPAAAHVEPPGARDSELPARYAWLVLGTLEGLRAYHPAFEAASTEEWLSVALHEFAHTSQLRLPSFAANLQQIDAHAASASRLAALYRGDSAYRRLVDAEYAQLVAAAWRAELPRAAVHQVLADWQALYRRRLALLARRPDAQSLIASDRLFTYIEGSARYVESQFLVDERLHPPRPLASDPSFRGYAGFAGQGYRGMPNKQIDAEYFYAIGFHLCVLLDRIDPGWRRTLHTQPDGVIGSVERLLSVAPFAGAPSASALSP